jgi:hypothetical protein
MSINKADEVDRLSKLARNLEEALTPSEISMVRELPTATALEKRFKAIEDRLSDLEFHLNRVGIVPKI